MLARSRSQRRGFGLEQLEGRDLMAGNVNVAVVNDDLVITGDNNGNQIIVHQSAGRLVVEGVNTKINGKDNAFKAFVKDDVRVDLNGGNDKLTVTHNTPLLFNTDIKGDLDVDEVETVKLNNLDLHGKLDVDLENVNASVQMFDYTIEGTATIHGSDGRQKADLATGFFKQNLKVDFAGSGDDDILLQAVNALKRVDLLTDRGEDDVRVDFFTKVGTDLNIETGDADDFISVKSTIITDDLTIDVGSGDNAVVIDSIIVDDIDINLDDGDDDVLTLAVEQADQVRIDADNDDVLDIDEDGIADLFVIND